MAEDFRSKANEVEDLVRLHPGLGNFEMNKVAEKLHEMPINERIPVAKLIAEDEQIAPNSLPKMVFTVTGQLLSGDVKIPGGSMHCIYDTATGNPKSIEEFRGKNHNLSIANPAIGKFKSIVDHYESNDGSIMDTRTMFDAAGFETSEVRRYANPKTGLYYHSIEKYDANIASHRKSTDTTYDRIGPNSYQAKTEFLQNGDRLHEEYDPVTGNKVSEELTHLNGEKVKYEIDPTAETPPGKKVKSIRLANGETFTF
jgi:hypothetical protein